MDGKQGEENEGWAAFSLFFPHQCMLKSHRNSILCFGGKQFCIVLMLVDRIGASSNVIARGIQAASSSVLSPFVICTARFFVLWVVQALQYS